MNPKLQSLLFLLVSCLLITTKAFAVDPVYTPWNSNLAIKGYDAVAYFLEEQAIKGSSTYEYDWQGATWRFSSEVNMNRFIKNPNDYAPQYGGYCAWAVSQNKTAGIDPEQFAIVDGKLYLNYNRNIQQRWLTDMQNLIQLANQNWPGLLED